MDTRSRLFVGLVVSLVVLPGCAQLTIEQHTLQGDSARGSTTRLSVARGIHAAILDKMCRASNSVTSAVCRDAQAEWERIRKLHGDKNLKDDKYERNALFEFAGAVERISADPGVREDAAEIKRVLRFPAFDQIPSDDRDWRLINPVQVFGGFGRSEYIIVRDDGGNFELKSAYFDPSKVIAAGVNAAAAAAKALATAYGVPLGTPAQPASTDGASTSVTAGYDPLTTPSLDQQTRLNREIARRLDAAAENLRRSLQSIQDTQLKADVTADLTDPTKATLLNDLRAAIAAYRNSVAGLSREVTRLQRLEASLPEASALDRLVTLFGVGSLTDAQVVALYWAYRVNPDVNDPREARLLKDALPGLVDFDASGRPTAREGVSASAVRTTLDDLNRGDKLLKRVQATRAKLKNVKNALAALKTYNAMVAALKPVFDETLANIDQAAEASRKDRAAKLKAAVTTDFKTFVDSKPNVTGLSDAKLPDIQALSTKLPATTIATYDTTFKAIAALPGTPTVQDLNGVKDKVTVGLLVPVTLPAPEPQLATDLHKDAIVVSP
jgi:hypothetical protein